MTASFTARPSNCLLRPNGAGHLRGGWSMLNSERLVHGCARGSHLLSQRPGPAQRAFLTSKSTCFVNLAGRCRTKPSTLFRFRSFFRRCLPPTASPLTSPFTRAHVVLKRCSTRTSYSSSTTEALSSPPQAGSAGELVGRKPGGCQGALRALRHRTRPSRPRGCSADRYASS